MLFELCTRITNCLTTFIHLSNVVILVNNMKHPSLVITMNMLQNFYTPIQIDNYNLLFLSYCLRGKSEPPLLNDKVKIVNSGVKRNRDIKTVDEN